MPLNVYGQQVDEQGHSTWDGRAQYDAQGRQFFVDPTGQKSYTSPAVRGGQLGPNGETDQASALPSGGGIFHNRPSWNQHTGQVESGLDWGNILSMVVAGIMTAGVANAVMGAPAGTAEAMIDSGAAAGSPGGLSGATLGMPNALPGAVSGVGGPAGTVASVGTAAAKAATPLAGEGVRQGLLGPSMESQYDANNAASDNGSGFHLPAGSGGKILQALTALGSAGIGHALSNQAGSGNVPPELQQMLQMALSRGKYQQPLFEAANRGMYDMLPNFARTPNATFPTGGG